LGDSFSSGEGDPPFDAGTDLVLGPQRDLCHRSADATTDLVTITIGGNDVWFANILAACLVDLVICSRIG